MTDIKTCTNLQESNKQPAKHRWKLPLIWCEQQCEKLERLLKSWAFLDILERLGHLAVLIAIVFYFVESDDRQKQKHYQAWQVIYMASGHRGDGGRITALEDLNRDKVCLIGLDVQNTFLEGIDLRNATLSEARFDEAQLTGAKFNGSDLRFAVFTRAILMQADFSGAILIGTDFQQANLEGINVKNVDMGFTNLRKANLKNLKNWKEIKSIKYSCIYEVENPPKGFLEWAKNNGAIENSEDYNRLINEEIGRLLE